MKTKEKIIAVVQARMGSNRLPGKVLMPILGKPMLWYILNRLKTVKDIDKIIVATSTESEDDKIEKFCECEGFNYFRGSESDVLDRFYKATFPLMPDYVIRITADCPLIDPIIIQKLIDIYINSEFDYYSVATGAGVAKERFSWYFPDGLDAEIFSFKVLERAWNEATTQLHREHVTPYIWQNPNEFKLGSLKSDFDYSNLRWTVDNKEDLELIKWIYESLYPKNSLFGMNDVLKLLEKNPDKLKVNQSFIGKEKYEEFWQ